MKMINKSKFLESEEVFHALIDQAPDAIFVVNINGDIVYANYQASELFEFGFDELLGAKVEMLIPGDFVKHTTLRKEYFNNPQLRTMGQGLDLYGLKKDKEKFPVAISLSPFITGDELFVIATVRDITYRKQAEKEISHLNNELLLLDHTKNLFLQMVSHELRTPLHGIIGFTNMIAEKVDSAEVLQYIDHLKMLNQRLEKFTNTALIITKLRLKEYEFHFQRVELLTLINELLPQYEFIMREGGLSIRLNVEQSLCVNTDKELLQICICNLLDNAVKFSPKGGIIEIVAAFDRNQIKISITDQGAGFSESSLEKAFKLFANEDSHFDNNMGLGLALCKLIVEAIGGNITVHQDTNCGACLIIALPVEQVKE